MNNPQKEALIQEVVSKLQYFSKLYGINSIFIAGGYCRERYLDSIWKTKDIDVASAYEDQAVQLGGLFASEILHSVPRFYERTGTALVEYTSELGSIKVEFQNDSVSTYMHNEEVRAWMQHHQIENVPLMNNLYGRDFTINSLVYSLNNGHMYDPTGRAINDFKRKRISSLLPADMLIKYNPLAGLRALRFSLEYDFYIESDLRIAIKSLAIDSLRASVTEKRIVQEVAKVLRTKPKDAIKLLKKFELDRILLHPDIKEYLYLGAK